VVCKAATDLLCLLSMLTCCAVPAAQLSGAAVEGGLPGLQHVLGRLERTPMACVTKV